MDVPEPAQPTAVHNKRASLPWSPLWAVFYLIFIFFSSQIVGAVCLSLYARLRHWNGQQAQDWLNNSVVGQFSFILITEALIIAGVLLFLWAYRTKWSVIGLKWPRWRDPLYGLLAYVSYLVTFAVVLSVATNLIPSLNVDQKQEIGFNNVYGTIPMLLTFVSLVILPPLAEELLVRGFLFTSLRKWLSLIPAALITSLVFAAAHLPEGGAAGPLYVAAIDTFFLSLYLCWLREKTGSLWAGVTLHALKNLLAFLSLFVFASR